MRLLFLMALLIIPLAINAQENSLEKKRIKLELSPDFNDEMKHQGKMAKGALLPTIENQAEEKSIFDNPKRSKHQFSMGVAAGNTVNQDGIKPITLKPLQPKMNTVYEK
jgi:hypothetical protein